MIFLSVVRAVVVMNSSSVCSSQSSSSTLTTKALYSSLACVAVVYASVVDRQDESYFVLVAVEHRARSARARAREEGRAIEREATEEEDTSRGMWAVDGKSRRRRLRAKVRVGTLLEEFARSVEKEGAKGWGARRVGGKSRA